MIAPLHREQSKIFWKSGGLLFAVGSPCSAFTKPSHARHAVAKDSRQCMTMDRDRGCTGIAMTMEGKITEEASMTARAEAHVASDASRRIALPSCPQCNDLQLAPLASEFVSQGQVRHFWSCEACGHEFTTSVKLPVGGAKRR
jgi:uncharacterized protein with PIN domain